MRRLFIAAAALACLAAPVGPRTAFAARTNDVDCTDYCGERAAARCQRIDSWNCTWYILGCLAGCNIASL